MNSQDAMDFVGNLVAEGKFRRISSADRQTKAIIYQTLSGRNFAVEINDTKSRNFAMQTKIVCEHSPNGMELPWDEIGNKIPVTVTDRQFESSAYKLKDARLAPGNQKSVYIADTVALGQFLEWYEGAGMEERMSDINRNAVETAMDAFDRYREGGEHDEFFSHFGDPRDYWVRSTRERGNRVYPTKPIVGFIRKKTELNAGWGEKGDAAARLHNSGFIIVDQDNKPVVPPERYDHLIRDADRIRLCALNYYIEPARERGENRATIRAGTLHNDMG